MESFWEFDSNRDREAAYWKAVKSRDPTEIVRQGYANLFKQTESRLLLETRRFNSRKILQLWKPTLDQDTIAVLFRRSYLNGYLDLVRLLDRPVTDDDFRDIIRDGQVEIYRYVVTQEGLQLNQGQFLTAAAEIPTTKILRDLLSRIGDLKQAIEDITVEICIYPNMRLLVEAGLDPTFPLEYAVVNRDDRIVRYLLDSGAQFDDYLLTESLQSGNPKIVQLLLDRFGPPEYPESLLDAVLDNPRPEKASTVRLILQLFPPTRIKGQRIVSTIVKTNYIEALPLVSQYINSESGSLLSLVSSPEMVHELYRLGVRGDITLALRNILQRDDSQDPPIIRALLQTGLPFQPSGLLGLIVTRIGRVIFPELYDIVTPTIQAFLDFQTVFPPEEIRWAIQQLWANVPAKSLLRSVSRKEWNPIDDIQNLLGYPFIHRPFLEYLLTNTYRVLSKNPPEIIQLGLDTILRDVALMNEPI